MRAYGWPGNVRELENVIERALILSCGQDLAFDSLGPGDRPLTADGPGGAAGRAPSAGESEGRPEELDQAVNRHIRRVLRYAEGKVGGQDGAAAVLAVSPSTLRNRMKKLGIPYGRR